jgi:hypothetical protein
MHSRLRIALPLLPLLLFGCTQEPVSSPAASTPTARAVGGLMEITITGIGTPQARASARAVGVGSGGALVAPSVARLPWGGRTATLDVGRFALLPSPGTIQLQGVSVASFTYGARGAGGYRYVSATFNVRNADAGGTAYGSDRHNLTLLGVDGSGSLDGTAITTLARFDNSPASTGLALSVVPTGWADLSATGTISTRGPDILQVFTDSEVGALGLPPGATAILPYGFVVSNRSSTTSRTLLANQATYDGQLTVAFKVPLQATAADDPFTINGLFLAVDDREIQVTQSFEDSSATSAAAAAARAAALGASAFGDTSRMRSMVGAWAGGKSARFMCTVRTAGTAVAPTAHLGDAITVSSVTPGAGTSITKDQTLSATLSGAVSVTSLSFTSFAVNGFISGRAFRSGGYTGGGSANISAPAGTFLAGEEVEVALTPTLLGAPPALATTRVCPYVYRYRVATASATGTFADGTGSPFTMGVIPSDPLVPIGPHGIAVGNVDESSAGLDIVVVNDTAHTLQVLSGDGSGGFTVGAEINTGGQLPEAVALGDVNGDGHLDAIVPTANTSNVSVLLGNGDGTFTYLSDYPIASGPNGIVLGDFNGDGYLDMAAPSYDGDSVGVLLGNGTGYFTKAQGPAPTTGGEPLSIAAGDFNRDGKLDLVVGNFSGSTVTVLRGDGTGRFTEVAGSPFSLDGQPYQVAVGDMNKDGIPDIVTANKSTNTVSVLTGNGSFGFTKLGTTGFSTGGSQPQALALGDVDGDGNLDVVVANYTSGSTGTASVLLGSATGSLGTATTVTAGAGPSGVALGAFKTSGDQLGIAVANLNAKSVSVLFRP